MGEGEGLRVSVNTAGAADVDNDSGFSVLNTEVRSGGLGEFKGCGSVDSNHLLPLLIAEL